MLKWQSSWLSAAESSDLATQPTRRISHSSSPSITRPEIPCTAGIGESWSSVLRTRRLSASRGAVAPGDISPELRAPHARGDGWMEMEMEMGSSPSRTRARGGVNELEGGEELGLIVECIQMSLRRGREVEHSSKSQAPANFHFTILYKMNVDRSSGGGCCPLICTAVKIFLRREQFCIY